MQFLDVLSGTDSRKQRWSHYLTLAFAVLGLLVGVNLRDSTLYATTTYIENEVGIRVEYPRGWLIDFDGDYIFRLRDMTRVGFKTQIEVAVHPFSPDMAPRNILDDLALERARTTIFSEVDRREITLRNNETASLSEYIFVYIDPDPFLAPLPVVVLGQDILLVRRGQAIRVTFVADSSTFDEDYAIFERFLASLEI